MEYTQAKQRRLSNLASLERNLEPTGRTLHLSVCYVANFHDLCQPACGVHSSLSIIVRVRHRALDTICRYAEQRNSDGLFRPFEAIFDELTDHRCEHGWRIHACLAHNSQ
jgi:hypothetical protein